MSPSQHVPVILTTMSITKTLIYGESGQTVEFCPSFVADSGATYVLYDLSVASGSNVLASGTCTTGTLNVGMTADAGPGQADPSELRVTSNTALSYGDKFVIVDISGSTSMRYEVTDLYSTTFVRVQPRLFSTFTSGSTLRDPALSFTVPDSAVTTERYLVDDTPLMAVFDVTVRGARTTQSVPIRINRRNATDIDVAEILRRIALRWTDAMGKFENRSDNSVRSLVEEAIAKLKVDLDGTVRDWQQVLLGDLGSEMIIQQVGRLMSAHDIAPGSKDANVFGEDCKREYDRLLFRLQNGVAGHSVVEVEKKDERTDGSHSWRAKSVIWGS